MLGCDYVLFPKIIMQVYNNQSVLFALTQNMAEATITWQ